MEIQQTFYQLPRPATAERWRAEAPPGFTYALKAWQLVTHRANSPTYRRLREPLAGAPGAYGAFQDTPEVHAAWARTLGFAQALGARIVVFQCPASFTPTPGNLANLRRFFTRAERAGLTFAWEPRGSWDPALVRDLCRELGLVHCVDPFAADSTYGEIAYFRLHGRDGYRYRYTDADLRELARTCRAAQDSGRRGVYVLFNNASMLDDARRFQRLLRQP